MMEASQHAIIDHDVFDPTVSFRSPEAAGTSDRESHRFATVVLQTLELPDAHRAPRVIRELGLSTIDSVLPQSHNRRPMDPLTAELDDTRLSLLRHIARLDELRDEHAQRLRTVEIQIAALQRAICRVPSLGDELGATPALSNAVERLGNLLVSQSILKRIGPQIALAQRTHEALVEQIESALQAAEVA